MQSNLSYILLILLLCSSLTNIKSQDIKPEVPPIPIITKDSVAKATISLPKTIKKDSLLTQKKDSIQVDSIRPKESITDLISHVAKDYTTQNAKNKTVTLYNEAHLVYTDIDLKAGIIVIDYIKNTLFAKGIKDSTGYNQRPVFKQGNQESEQDSMVYNFKTKKAIIYGIKTKQEPEMFGFYTENNRFFSFEVVNHRILF